MKQTTMLRILPLLAGVSLLILFILFSGCTGQAPGSRLEGTGWTLTGMLIMALLCRSLPEPAAPLISVKGKSHRFGRM
jgi:sorbitol-specific phosphotransferase system component IIBC